MTETFTDLDMANRRVKFLTKQLKETAHRAHEARERAEAQEIANISLVAQMRTLQAFIKKLIHSTHSERQWLLDDYRDGKLLKPKKKPVPRENFNPGFRPKQRTKHQGE